jgi:curved DNA-binding protein CbpA
MVPGLLDSLERWSEQKASDARTSAAFLDFVFSTRNAMMLGPMAELLPRVVPGAILQGLRLDPTDGFILSRIDGIRTRDAIASETGLSSFAVERSIEKLIKLGVVEWFDPSAPAPPPKRSAPPRVASAPPRPEASYDPRELDEPADLTVEQKKRILDLFHTLADLDHYTLLGVSRQADKKAVKRAYFELAALFHPDRYFKKQLGSFKLKMSAVFDRLTLAHDTLIDRDSRAEYDATLGPDESLSQRETAAKPPPSAASSFPPSRGAPSSASELSSHASPLSTPSMEELQRRREALARRLAGGARPAPSPASSPDVPSSRASFASPTDAMDALKRRYLERLDAAATARRNRHAEAQANASGGSSEARASSARLAAAPAVSDPYGPSSSEHGSEPTPEEQAEVAASAEREGRWNVAARLWQRVAVTRNDATSHERTANAILQQPDGDLRQAAEHARQAIALDPAIAQNHATLVEILLKAGHTASARRAAELAAALAPHHEGLKALLKRIPKH